MIATLTTEPVWIREDAVLAIHQRQLAEHGGLEGVRDAGLLSSALHRPQQIYHYSEGCTLIQLAAAYGFGIAKNHAFIDGNKRTAYIVTRLFLVANGWDIDATQQEKYTTTMALAAGDLTEEQFAAWLKKVAVPLKKPVG